MQIYIKVSYLDLNTSHVKVKLICITGGLWIIWNLNTSHVKVKQVELMNGCIVVITFKYISC